MALVPNGCWWLSYNDGTVWPCEVVSSAVFPGYWIVAPQAPAPDAGESRVEPTGRIIDSAGNRPRVAT